MSIRSPYRLTPSAWAVMPSYSLAVNNSNASKATSSSRELLELANSKQRAAEFVRFSISGMTASYPEPHALVQCWFALGLEPFVPSMSGLSDRVPFAHSPRSGQIEASWEASSSPLLSQEIRLFG